MVTSIAEEELLYMEDKRNLFDDELRPGDLERAVLEWRSLLGLIAHAPALKWNRWEALQVNARSLVDANSHATQLPKLPPLAPEQRKRHQSRLQRTR